MFSERTSVGLDVHARSVVAAAIDGQTGEVFKARLTPSHAEVLEWIGKLSSLTRLEIVHTQFTDAGARSLAGLVNLERLQLGSRKATGASLAVLRKEVEPVDHRALARFLPAWQNVDRLPAVAAEERSRRFQMSDLDRCEGHVSPFSARG